MRSLLLSMSLASLAAISCGGDSFETAAPEPGAAAGGSASGGSSAGGSTAGGKAGATSGAGASAGKAGGEGGAAGQQGGSAGASAGAGGDPGAAGDAGAGGGPGGATQAGGAGGEAVAGGAGAAGESSGGASGGEGGAAGGPAGGASGQAGEAQGGAAGASEGGQGGAVSGGAAGSAQAGAAQGGGAQGGSAQGGGGSAQAGSAQGGSAQAGSAQGGSAQAGSAQGGSGQGGGPLDFGPGFCNPLAPFDNIEVMAAPINDPNPDNTAGDFTAWMDPSQTFIAWARGNNSDIWYSSLDFNGDWMPPDDLKGSGSAGFDFFPSLLPDLKTMYFTSDRDGPTAFRLYVIKRPSVGDNFSGPAYVEVPGRKEFDRDFGGQVTSDGQTLYFASTRAVQNTATYNPKLLDIYVLRHLGTGQAAVEALDTVNAAGAEDAYPAVSNDQRVLYIGSRRGGGAYDIHVSARTSTALPFPAPVPVTSLNTADVDVPNWVSDDYCTVLFHRTVGGRSRIYRATRTMP